MEYELRWAHGWQWFMLPTEDAAAVSVGLVMQRGSSRNFPRMGFVAMASSSGVPPATLNGANEYDPITYTHDDPIGARRQVIYQSPIDGTRPRTDWHVITLGVDTNRSVDAAHQVQVPLGKVLIGLRCQEKVWTWPYYPGCRVSLTAVLLPFVMTNELSVSAPMARGHTHVYKVTVGDYDTLNVSLTRDVQNVTHEPARGLVGAALLNLEQWARPAPLFYPYNLSGASPDTDLPTYPGETKAMQTHQYAQLRADKGLVNLRGCASGQAGCRGQYFPVASDSTADPELEKQELHREHLFARALPTGRGYAALHEGTHATHLGRVCVGPGAEGTYYLTLYADAALSGDGRLSASSDGYDATVGDQPVEGVDAFGWWQNADFHGCFCVGDDAGLPSGTAGLCTGAVPQCAQKTMPPPSRRRVQGYTMHITHLAFARGLVPVVNGSASQMGCVSYGQIRRYEIRTGGLHSAQVHLQLSHPVGQLLAAAGTLPTADAYALRATPPLRELTLSPCDVTEPTIWHVAVLLGEEEADGVEETLFTMDITSTSASASLLDARSTYSGAACCGGYSYWLVEHVPSREALRVHLNVTSGALHALLLQYDSCPTYLPGDPYTCAGLCEMAFVTHWDVISGSREDRGHLTLTVPMGEDLVESDKRRAGNWYVGVKALPNEAGTYTLRLSTASPRTKPPTPYCSGVDRFCASSTQRYATVPVTTAADARAPGDDFLSSPAAPAIGGGRQAGWPLAAATVAAAALLLVAAGRGDARVRTPSS